MREAYKMESTVAGLFCHWFQREFSETDCPKRTIGYALKDCRLCTFSALWGVGWWWGMESPWNKCSEHWSTYTLDSSLWLVYSKWKMLCKYKELSSGRTYFTFLSFNGPNDIKLHKISIATKWKVQISSLLAIPFPSRRLFKALCFI